MSNGRDIAHCQERVWFGVYDISSTVLVFSFSRCVAFFLLGVAETSKQGAKILLQALNLEEHLLEKKIPKVGKRAKVAMGDR
jgi:hypothetical protein